MSELGEYDFEPVPGLPEALPDGESIVWQGAPSFKAVALHVLHVRKLLIYFSVLLVLRQVWLAGNGQSLVTDLASTAGLALVAVFTLAMLLLLSKLIAKTTLYTITSRRVVLRIGVALPMTLNLPFSRLDAADVRLNRDGSGDIFMRLRSGKRLGYIVLWPHLRPLRIFGVQPSLRGLPDPAEAARHLAQAVAADLGETVALPAARVSQPGVAALGH